MPRKKKKQAKHFLLDPETDPPHPFIFWALSVPMNERTWTLLTRLAEATGRTDSNIVGMILERTLPMLTEEVTYEIAFSQE